MTVQPSVLLLARWGAAMELLDLIMTILLGAFSGVRG
jgi:hypothetical protein